MLLNPQFGCMIKCLTILFGHRRFFSEGSLITFQVKTDSIKKLLKNYTMYNIQCIIYITRSSSSKTKSGAGLLVRPRVSGEHTKINRLNSQKRIPLSVNCGQKIHKYIGIPILIFGCRR